MSENEVPDEEKLQPEDEIKKIFSNTGPLAKILPGFEPRPGQIDMAEAIQKATAEQRHLLLEAGTGVGKTLAYLIPLAVAIRDSGKKAGISTETKTLQNQILEKEIKILKKLGFSIQYSVAYGQGNFLCKRRLAEYVKRGTLYPDDSDLLDNIIRWSRSTDSGLRHRIPFSVPNRLWKEIQRDPDTSPNQNCPYYESCFYQAARISWYQSDLIIMNHSLYSSFLRNQNSLLQSLDFFVFDEAHNLDKIMTDHLSSTVSMEGLTQIISYVWDNGKGRLSGTRNREAEIRKLVEKIYAEATRFFGSLQLRENARFERLFKPLADAELVRRPLEQLRQLVIAIAKEQGLSDSDQEMVLIEAFIKNSESMETMLRILEAWDENSKKFVSWKFALKTDQLPGLHTAIQIAPLELSDFMNQILSRLHKAVFFVSATLSVNGDFFHYLNRLGIHKDKMDARVFPSPFDYKKQVIFYTSSHITDPRSDNDKFIENIGFISERLVRITGGYAFLLFTSYKSLQETYERMKHLGDEGFTLLVQEGQSAAQVLQTFLESDRPILFGTNSFWQGVDIAGDRLRLVVLTKIPFDTPDDPIQEAKYEIYQKRGLNPFMHLSLGNAVIRLKQGFGRLIRTVNDRGIIALLDSRLYHQAYGKIILQSLPECTHLQKLQQVEQFYPNLMANQVSEEKN